MWSQGLWVSPGPYTGSSVSTGRPLLGPDTGPGHRDRRRWGLTGVGAGLRYVITVGLRLSSQVTCRFPSLPVSHLPWRRGGAWTEKGDRWRDTDQEHLSGGSSPEYSSTDSSGRTWTCTPSSFLCPSPSPETHGPSTHHCSPSCSATRPLSGPPSPLFGGDSCVDVSNKEDGRSVQDHTRDGGRQPWERRQEGH